MSRFIAILLLAAVSISVTSCFDKNYPTQIIYVQDTTRNNMGVKNPIAVKFIYPSSSQALFLFSEGQLVYNNTGSLLTSDSLIVPDSSYLYARWGTNHADTIASPGLVWTIQ